ncbi:MAG: phosphoglycerate mutase [Luteibacter sp.]
MAAVVNVLLPGRDKLAHIAPFSAWLARGTMSPAALPGYLVAMAEHFRWPGGRLPAAALIRQSVAGDAGDALWLSADPAWVQPELNGARLLACGNLGLTVEESASLVAALAETFEAEGMTLCVGDAQHWQLRLPGYIDVPAFPEPEEALGADLFEQLPKGEAGRRWRALINEAQVVLHNHPVNRSRASRHLPPVNSVWLWGAGVLPDWVECGLSCIYSDDLLAWAVGHRADVEVQARGAFLAPARVGASSLAKETPARQGGAGSYTLLDLQDIQPHEFERDWWPALEARLADGAELRLAFADGVRIVLKKSHRLRFWRKA